MEYEPNSQIVDMGAEPFQRPEANPRLNPAVAKTVEAHLVSSPDEDAEFDRIIQKSLEKALVETEAEMDKEIVEMKLI